MCAQTLAASGPAASALGVNLPVAWLLAAGVLACAALGRRRLPAGVGEGLFVAGLSGVLVTTHLAGDSLVGWPLRLGALLTGLAVLWHLVVRWVERDRAVSDAAPAEAAPKPAAAERPFGRSNRQLVGGHAVVLCGLLTAGAALALPADSPVAPRLGLTLCLAVLLALAVRRHVDRAGPFGRLAGLGLLACTLYLWIPAALARPHIRLVSVLLVVAALVGSAAALLPVWQHWQFRRRVWRTEPQRLADPPARHPVLLGGVLVLSVLIGVGGVLVPQMLLTPPAVALAAVSAFVVGHRWESATAAEIGLALLAESVILAAVAWLPGSGVNPLLGCALAAVFLLWLARFWQQQLHDGTAWTTAGRLIPLARRLGHAAALGCFALAATAAAAIETEPNGALWPVVVMTVLLLGLLMSMLARDATREGALIAAFAAAPVILAATVPAQRLLAAGDACLPWPLLLGGASLLLALRVGPQRGEHESDAVYNAYIGGILPVAGLYAVAVDGAYGGGWLAGPVTAVLFALAIGLRWRRGGKSESCAKPPVTSTD